ncbi:MAG TPA: CDP-alcohol phosphatidyltransferase family protein [Anaerolineae bacterium]|nr:CDP-alcohol phosphatidyltransferase family protein [Anaerolineae bacterium]
MTIDKVPAADKFLDLSDYARPIARRLTRALVNTRITPIQITIAYTVIGLIAALLFAMGGYFNGVVAGILLLVKSTLDAVDGSLARARNRPSRLGRFLDSLCDYFINAAVIFGIASNGGAITIEKAILAVLTLESATWQGSAFNYYYVYYRKLTRGDTTSQVNETEAENYPWDNPRVVQALLNIYLIVYGWQDALLARLDRAITPDRASPIYRDKHLLTAITVMGTGFQLLLIALCAWFDRAAWALGLFIGPLNIYWVIIILLRYRISHQAA